MLAVLTSAPRPDRQRVRELVATALADPSLGPHVGIAVDDLTHGDRLVRRGAGSTFVPASVTKLFTVAAALRVLGPDRRFETTVMAVPGTHRIVLVGGGDPLLQRRAAAPEVADGYPLQASLAKLASRRAAALQYRGVDRVRLDLDASLFVGPSVNPHWPLSYVSYGVVRPITALAVADGRVPGRRAGGIPDPVAAAGASFVAMLERRGIDVVGAPRHRPAPRRAVDVATVRSVPLVEVTDEVLALSDNTAAEVLLRQVALERGRPPSFAGGVSAVGAALRGLGVDMRGVRLYDGSGLARDNAVSLDAVLGVLALAADPSRPQLRPLLVELPVAGFSGSLVDRFTARGANAGRGLVRAKTGTLTGVHALAGVVVDRDGTLLGFVAIVDQVRRRDTLDARDALDRLTAALAACGCA